MPEETTKDRGIKNSQLLEAQLTAKSYEKSTNASNNTTRGVSQSQCSEKVHTSNPSLFPCFVKMVKFRNSNYQQKSIEIATVKETHEPYAMPPVPVYVKGGVWTNVEDQILKAAVSKYGTHQWSKIASLLRKKSARQCQIRWTEFLNPNLNRAKFTKDEDVRLLQLSQQFPNQWRTIGELMGRTAQLCNERYNKLLTDPSLLDRSIKKEDGNLIKSKSANKFKVGDLNPQIDTQQALPDKEELEDEEKEMLAEARERLLSTQGKKATRKIRERMLEESKRIAQLQKRRELKQAGITTKIKKMKKKYSTEIDYNVEIPYEQTPLSGKYDTIAETERSRKELDKFEREFEKNASRNKSKRSDDDEVDTRDEQNSRRRKKRKHNNKDNLEETSKATTKLKDKPRPKLVLSKPGIDSFEPLEVTIDNSRFDILNKRNEESIFKIDESNNENIVPKIETTHNNYDTVQKEISVDDEFTKLLKQRQLVHFFEMLPTPNDDFDIILDEDAEDEDDEDETEMNKAEKDAMIDEEQKVEEQEIEKTETERNDNSEGRQKTGEQMNAKKLDDVHDASKIVLKLPCLQKTNNIIPPETTYPQDKYDEMYNTLVKASKNQSEYVVDKSLLESFQEIEKMIQQEIETDPKKLAKYNPPSHFKPPDYSEMLDEVKEKELQVKKLQKQFDYLKPLIARNEELNYEIYKRALPQLQSLQDEYSVTYKIYLDEQRETRQR